MRSRAKARLLVMLMVKKLVRPLLLLFIVMPTPATWGVTHSFPTQALAGFNYLVTIIMENHPLNGTSIGVIPNAPYITSLANTYSLAENYLDVFSGGSLPNYLGMIAGQTLTTCNSTPATCGTFPGLNIVDRIESGGLTWKAYMEDMPSNCYASDSGKYYAHHNPFLYFEDITNNTSRCNRVVPAGTNATTLLNDLNSTSTASNYMWLTPNACNDMHDPLPECFLVGDNYMKSLVPKILNSTIFKTQPSAMFIVWDEPSTSSCLKPNPSPPPGSDSCQVPAIWIGPNVKKPFLSNTPYDHYSYLKTVENAWGLSPLTVNDTNATPMTEFFSSTASVGGLIIPVDKLALLAPYVGLTIVFASIAIAAVASIRRWRGKPISRDLRTS